MNAKFEALMSRIKKELGESLVSLRIFTPDGILLYSEPQGTGSEDQLIAMASALFEIGRNYFNISCSRERPIVILFAEGNTCMISKLTEDVMISACMKDNRISLREDFRNLLAELAEYLGSGPE
ncbi:MAG: hypothetical protein QXO55_06200 [Candidatus Korarchaeum sp.]